MNIVFYWKKILSKKWLEKYYNDPFPSKTLICEWFSNFKRGNTYTNDTGRFGRSTEIITLSNIDKISHIIFYMLKMSTERVGNRLHEYLHMNKHCAR